ncbi:SGNH/GDSL hydrolase family protein [Streptomyces sp. NPDC090994]|uniref:SGNH/GDSL hydrolase family protein n=1 Tax=Streptomyces sp. NPDC090994 TaxID=3365969 RepID=UPI00380AEF1C
MNSTHLRALLLTAVVSAGVLTAPAARAADDAVDYVALGDSFAAAPLVQPVDASNLLCMRSLSDYPHIAAGELGVDLTDVSCSAATVEHLSTSQYPGTAPQYEALSEDTDLVSITIGGNDTSLVTTAFGCVNVLPEPAGSSCAAENTEGGTDQVADVIDAWAPQFDTVLETVHRLAPRARVFVVGYGNYIRPGGCFPVQPLWSADATYLQEKVDHLAGVLERSAARHDATFVDTYPLGVGHDSCADPADRYIEGFVPTHPALPLHPNADGSRAIGRALADAMRTVTDVV